MFAFGLSEKEHGADIYSSDMMLYPQADGTYKANGDKYYIGNGNEAALVSTFAKMADTGEYVFFVVDSKHKNYECIRNVVNEQNYVAEYALHDYPITDADITEKGQKAWDDMLNTINVCKFNLGFGAIGLCTHALYESIDHAANRNVYGKFVTDFPAREATPDRRLLPPGGDEALRRARAATTCAPQTMTTADISSIIRW